MKNLLIIILIGIGLYSCNETKKTKLQQADLQDESIPIIEHFCSDSLSKNALFIFAHGDDETACAGTITKLKELNYNIGVVILTDQGKDIRYSEFLKSMELLEVDYYEQFSIRITNYNSWNEIIKNKTLNWKGDTIVIRDQIIDIIDDFKPSIMFTWDNKIGLYGHPDHILLSQIVNEVFDNQNKYLKDTVFIEKLYMITLSKGLEEHILKKMDFYKELISRYNETEISQPDVSVKISQYGEIKKSVLLAYKSEYKSALSKFFPEFKETDANEYFRIYDREYYIVKTKQK